MWLRGQQLTTRETDSNDAGLVQKYNLIFVAISVIFFVFSRSAFRLIFVTFESFGNVPPTVFLFFSVQCKAIETYPIIYLLVCISFYIASVRFFKTKTNAIINTGLLFYFALLMLNVSGAFFEWKDAAIPPR